jgi:uncharacterized protein YoxC
LSQQNILSHELQTKEGTLVRTWDESKDSKEQVKQHIKAMAASVNDNRQRRQNETQQRQQHANKFLPF